MEEISEQNHRKKTVSEKKHYSVLIRGKVPGKDYVTSEKRKGIMFYVRQHLESLLPLLSNERFENDSYWLDIAQVIFNILGHKGKEKFINLSIQHSRTSEDSEEMYYYTHSVVNGYIFKNRVSNNTDLTIKTLALFAKQDSPVEFERWNKEFMKDIFYRSHKVEYKDLKHQFVVYFFGKILDRYLCEGCKYYLHFN